MSVECQCPAASSKARKGKQRLSVDISSETAPPLPHSLGLNVTVSCQSCYTQITGNHNLQSVLFLKKERPKKSSVGLMFIVYIYIKHFFFLCDLTFSAPTSLSLLSSVRMVYLSKNQIHSLRGIVVCVSSNKFIVITVKNLFSEQNQQTNKDRYIYS